MANKRPKPEEIVSKLPQVEVLVGQGISRLDAIRLSGVIEQVNWFTSSGFRRIFRPFAAVASSEPVLRCIHNVPLSLQLQTEDARNLTLRCDELIRGGCDDVRCG